MAMLSTQRIPIAVLVWLFLLLTTVNAIAEEITLAVANSTCHAIKQVGKLYQQQHPSVELNYICKSSGRLAKGLHGNLIKADIYISANRKWIEYMIDAELVSSDQVVSPWGNELVVATPVNSNITDFNWEDLAEKKVEKILIGDPGTAPFGRYAKQAFISTNLWKKVRHKIETKKHITLLAENLVQASPHTVGILFFSNLNDSLRVVQAVDPSWHAPIEYYMAPLQNTEPNSRLASLLNFIQQDSSQAVFLKQGFKLATQ